MPNRPASVPDQSIFSRSSVPNERVSFVFYSSRASCMATLVALYIYIYLYIYICIYICKYMCICIYICIYIYIFPWVHIHTNRQRGEGRACSNDKKQPLIHTPPPAPHHTNQWRVACVCGLPIKQYNLTHTPTYSRRQSPPLPARSHPSPSSGAVARSLPDVCVRTRQRERGGKRDISLQKSPTSPQQRPKRCGND